MVSDLSKITQLFLSLLLQSLFSWFPPGSPLIINKLENGPFIPSHTQYLISSLKGKPDFRGSRIPKEWHIKEQSMCAIWWLHVTCSTNKLERLHQLKESPSQLLIDPKWTQNKTTLGSQSICPMTAVHTGLGAQQGKVTVIRLRIHVLNKAYNSSPHNFLLPLSFSFFFLFNEATNSVESGDLNSNHFPFALYHGCSPGNLYFQALPSRPLNQ